ncbi:14259_t:CDS:2 [Funneliformis caledonium]|uniref:14259_t:CDS:1 n=1 Tax=Funneliformis caledonium TaxID=1117310 RepID=A0A9N9N1W5_9GLOM|nr:14259_t:CDS:2 [Funneliformis caledonium]
MVVLVRDLKTYYRYSAYAENVGWNYPNGASAMQGHRNNIFNPVYRRFGYGTSSIRAIV